MKYLIVIITILFSSFFASAQGKDIATDTIIVQGNCGMCKKRIEDAAYTKGVKRADWDSETKQLVLIYRPSKISKEEVLKLVAKAGHSSDIVKAEEADYKELPDCCQYETNSCNH